MHVLNTAKLKKQFRFPNISLVLEVTYIQMQKKPDMIHDLQVNELALTIFLYSRVNILCMMHS